MAFQALDNQVFTCLSPLAHSDLKPSNPGALENTNLSSWNAHHHSVSLLIFSRPLPTLHCHLGLNFIDPQGGPSLSSSKNTQFLCIKLYQFSIFIALIGT